MSVDGEIKRLARERLPAPLLYRIRLLRAVRRARKRWIEARGEQMPNPLPTPLIISLTSFAPRFATLHLTLECLLRQTIRPDAILLWIAESELARLPRRVRDLEGRGITIRGCPDIRSYKKLVFALEEHPESFIATADDDVFYDPAWLETLVRAVEVVPQAIVCRRGHRATIGRDGRLAPYADWRLDIEDEAASLPSVDLVPTGVGGILYPPSCFDPRVSDRPLFERLCPTGDDLWFYWMARLRGFRHRRVGPKFDLLEWPALQPTRLMQENWAGGNDRQIRNLEAEFGNPLRF